MRLDAKKYCNLAEREGFEPSVPVTQDARLAIWCLRPLGHLSALPILRAIPRTCAESLCPSRRSGSTVAFSAEQAPPSQATSRAAVRRSDLVARPAGVMPHDHGCRRVPHLIGQWSGVQPLGKEQCGIRVWAQIGGSRKPGTRKQTAPRTSLRLSGPPPLSQKTGVLLRPTLACCTPRAARTFSSLSLSRNAR
jgi:hypothetical protein